ncbi:hypothetical protein SPRG_05364 [Saprolegnia parasitica CBS 223.65]|uniref:Uncharacterized protein n=1 Tax=Saprolegnia parasitica (strain CBS 223.65) TaxID=695850 RepID=A0A067CTU4_SAPPC|nr:hypothetical protein SPRG_05364 [Saprolegnia parasitica CBS 223.65]KDO30172.1 hypothetical protein SPRG_05364 [Saprolegnia parasitica CBS 223.65]|eukprot:XP_012199350.1 hypothetical protein SPRG_05364 [Saprolegnia parasitica CBS 223.65]
MALQIDAEEPETSDAVYPARSSSVASFNKQLRELETRYHRTRQQLDKTTLKHDAMAAEVRKVRADNKAYEKELAKKAALLQRLAADKKMVEAQAIANRDYAKRIEQKLAMGAKGQAAAARHAEMAARMLEMEKGHHETLLTLESKDDRIKDLEAKIVVFKRSLDVRVRELGLDNNVHNGLIYEIARLQETNASLALQLALEVDQSSCLKSVIATRDAELQAMDAARNDLESVVARREETIAARETTLASVNTDLKTLHEEKTLLLSYVQEQTEKLLKGEAAMKKQAAQHTQAIEALELELQRRTSTIDELTATAAESQQSYNKLLQAYTVTQEAITHERSTSDALRALLNEKANELEAEGHKLRTVSSEKESLRLREEALQATCTTQGADIVDLRRQVEALEARCGSLSDQVEAHAASTRALQDEMERSLVDLASVTHERNEAARAMNEAVTISATAMDEQQLLRDKLTAQAAQIEQLKQSKALLQNAMLEQLAALRKQLQLERVARVAAERKQPSSLDEVPPPPPPPTKVHVPYVLPSDTISTLTLQDLLH